MKKKISVMLADDHPMILEGFKAMLAGRDDLEVVEEAVDGKQLVELARRNPPDIILVDINMPGLNGLEAMAELKKQGVVVKFIVLSMHDEPEYIHRALSYGADGYLLKNIGRDELHRAIQSVFSGGKHYSPEVMTVLAKSLTEPTPGEVSEVTPREKEVLQLVAQGQSTKQIAAALGISIRTVESHRINMLKKLNVNNTAELVKRALELKILT